MSEKLAVVSAVAVFLSASLVANPAGAMPVAALGDAAVHAAPVEPVANVCGLNGCVAVHVRRAQPPRKPTGMARPRVAVATVTAPTVQPSNPLASLGSKLLQAFHLDR